MQEFCLVLHSITPRTLALSHFVMLSKLSFPSDGLLFVMFTDICH